MGRRKVIETPQGAVNVDSGGRPVVDNKGRPDVDGYTAVADNGVDEQANGEAGS